MSIPINEPPSEMMTSTGSVEPDINISDDSSETENSASPRSDSFQSEQDDSFGAGTWYSNKRVNGLFGSHHAHNSWASITGMGWKKMATGSDSACEALTMLASHCREKSCRIDFREDGSLVQEIYAW